MPAGKHGRRRSGARRRNTARTAAIWSKDSTRSSPMSCACSRRHAPQAFGSSTRLMLSTSRMARRSRFIR
jgi:hypothetical protein